jgi:hypothetical protein
MGRQLALGLLVAALWSTPRDGAANPYDISLRGLGRPPTNAPLSDPVVRRYKNLTSELVFALAPRPLAPAETLGMSGFEFSLVSTTADINETATYWQGQPGSPVFEGALPTHGNRGVPSLFWVPTVHIRKGLPLSTEVGINASYLAWSEMVLLGVEGKVALHESYVRWVPALSARGAVGRLFGSSDLDIVTIEADLLASLPFGVGGMVQLTPYAGYGFLFAHVNSQVLDETPYEVLDTDEQKGGEDGSLYTFPTLEWRDNQQGRVVIGLRLNVAMLELLYEFDMGLVGGAAGSLQSHSFKIGFDT